MRSSGKTSRSYTVLVNPAPTRKVVSTTPVESKRVMRGWLSPAQMKNSPAANTVLFRCKATAYTALLMEFGGTWKPGSNVPLGKRRATK